MDRGSSGGDITAGLPLPVVTANIAVRLLGDVPGTSALPICCWTGRVRGIGHLAAGASGRASSEAERRCGDEVQAVVARLSASGRTEQRVVPTRYHGGVPSLCKAGSRHRRADNV